MLATEEPGVESPVDRRVRAICDKAAVVEAVHDKTAEGDEAVNEPPEEWRLYLLKPLEESGLYVINPPEE